MKDEITSNEITRKGIEEYTARWSAYYEATTVVRNLDKTGRFV